MFTSWIEEMFTRSESRLPAASPDVVLLPHGLKRFGLRIKSGVHSEQYRFREFQGHFSQQGDPRCHRPKRDTADAEMLI